MTGIEVYYQNGFALTQRSQVFGENRITVGAQHIAQLAGQSKRVTS
jgi:hypothetical protein